MIAIEGLKIIQGDFAYDVNWRVSEHAELAQDHVGLTIGGLCYGEISPDGSAIVGDDGFLFIKGGSNSWDAQIAGAAVISKPDFVRSCDDLTEFREKCQSRGISSAVVIVPEKDIVYPEFSPNCRGVTLGKRSIDLFLEDFEEISYPLAGILDLKKHVEVYHKRDSHFNAFGGFVVANACLKKIGCETFFYREAPFNHAKFQDDLAVKWERFETMRRSVRPDYSETVLADGNPLTGLHLRIDSHVVKNGKKIIIYGDSYSWNPDAGLSRYMAYRFETVHFIWSRQIDWDVLDAIEPDAVVMESAERFLIGGLIRRG